MKTKNLTMDTHGYRYVCDQSVADALRSVLRALPSLHLAGESYLPSDLAVLIETRIATANAMDAALLTWAEKATAFLESDGRVAPALHDLRKMAPMLFGPQSPVLAALAVSAPRTKGRGACRG